MLSNKSTYSTSYYRNNLAQREKPGVAVLPKSNITSTWNPMEAKINQWMMWLSNSANTPPKNFLGNTQLVSMRKHLNGFGNPRLPWSCFIPHISLWWSPSFSLKHEKKWGRMGRKFIPHRVEKTWGSHNVDIHLNMDLLIKTLLYLPQLSPFNWNTVHTLHNLLIFCL